MAIYLFQCYILNLRLTKKYMYVNVDHRYTCSVKIYIRFQILSVTNFTASFRRHFLQDCCIFVGGDNGVPSCIISEGPSPLPPPLFLFNSIGAWLHFNHGTTTAAFRVDLPQVARSLLARSISAPFNSCAQ